LIAIAFPAFDEDVSMVLVIDKESLLDTEARQVVESLSEEIASIEILQLVSGGKSKSLVALVDVKPKPLGAAPSLLNVDRVQLLKILDGALDQDELTELIFSLGLEADDFPEAKKRPRIMALIGKCERDRRWDDLIQTFLALKPRYGEGGLKGIHYLKVHRDNSDAEDLYKVIELNDSVISPYIVGAAEHGGRMAVLYKPAQQSLRRDRVAPLTQLIEHDVAAAEQNLKGLAALLREWNSELRDDSATPYKLLENLLGPRRVRGAENVQTRMQRLMREFDEMRDQAPRLLDCSRMEFAGTLLLPNPIAFLEHPEWWEATNEFKTIKVQIGRVHNDLHAENIICRHGQSMGVDARPDIIDFATFRNDQAIYFDLVYLEFDVLMRLCKPEVLDNRRQLVDIVNYLGNPDDLELQGVLRAGALGSKVVDLVRPLRAAACKLFDPDRQEHSELTFWLCAVAVGLNFARKLTITPYDRLLGLLYAGVALRSVLDRYLVLSYAGGASVDVTWEGPRTKLPEPDEPDGVIAEVVRLIQDGENEVVFLLGPQETIFAQLDVIEDMRARLTWTDYPVDEDDPDIEEVITLDDALEKYQHYMTETNLRAALQAAARQASREGPSRLVPYLAALGAFPNVSFVTYDWDDTLDRYVAHWSGTKQVDDRVLHLCGCLSRPSEIHWLDRLPLDDSLDARGETAIHNTLVSRLRKANLVFLGDQPLSLPGWDHVIGLNLRERAQKWGVWLVDGATTAALFDVERLSMTAVDYSPLEFVARVAEELHGEQNFDEPPPMIAEAPRFPTEYEPNVVDQIRRIRDILSNDPRPRLLWVVQDELGRGKSAFVRKLVREHEAKMLGFSRAARGLDPEEEDDDLPRLPFSIIVDFATSSTNNMAGANQLAAERRGILHLLFDHFNCAVPDLRRDHKYRDYNTDEKVKKLIDAFANAPVFTVPAGGYAGFAIDDGRGGVRVERAEVLVCFDSLHLTDPTHITEWLCTELAPMLTNWSVRHPEAARAHFKIVLARRKRTRPPSMNFTRLWRFEEATLQPLKEQDALEMLLDYVCHARIPNVPDQDAARKNILGVINRVHNGRSAGELQAERYLEVSQGDAYALKALVAAHAELGYPDMGTWPLDEPTIQSEVILPAAWKFVKETLKFDPEQKVLEDIYKDVFLCRRVCVDLLHDIIASSDAEGREHLDAYLLINRLAYSGFITYENIHDEAYYIESETTWYAVSPVLHCVVRRSLRLVEPQRFSRVSEIAYEYMNEIVSQTLNDFIWRDTLVEAMYYYQELYEDGALNYGLPSILLKHHIAQYSARREFDQAGMVAAAQALYARGASVPLKKELLGAIDAMIGETGKLGNG
jgi:hypothetical protein